MSIQGLLNKNGVTKTLKAEDIFLKFDRKIWLSRKVELIKSGNTYSLNVSRASTVSKYWFINAVAFLCASILLSIPLAVGLIAKKITIQQNPEAQAYQKIIEKALAYSPYLDKVSNEIANDKLSIETGSKQASGKREKIITPKKQTLEEIESRREDLNNIQNTLESFIKFGMWGLCTQSTEQDLAEPLASPNSEPKKMKYEFPEGYGPFSLNNTTAQRLLEETKNELSDIPHRIAALQELENAIKDYDSMYGKKSDNKEPIVINIDVHPNERMIEESHNNDEVKLP